MHAVEPIEAKIKVKIVALETILVRVQTKFGTKNYPVCPFGFKKGDFKLNGGSIEIKKFTEHIDNDGNGIYLLSFERLPMGTYLIVSAEYKGFKIKSSPIIKTK